MGYSNGRAGGENGMKTLGNIVILSTVLAFAGCGPGQNATVPQAEPAGASFVDIGDHVVHFS